MPIFSARKAKYFKEQISMKVKKIYIVVCAVICLIGVAVNIGVFYFQMNLSSYSKINAALEEDWTESELLVSTIARKKSDVKDNEKVSYPGKVTYITRGKFYADNSEKWLDRTIPYFGAAKHGDKLNGYYKPDDPGKFEFAVPTGVFAAGVGISLAVDILLIVLYLALLRMMKKPPSEKKAKKEKKVKKAEKAVSETEPSAEADVPKGTETDESDDTDFSDNDPESDSEPETESEADPDPDILSAPEKAPAAAAEAAETKASAASDNKSRSFSVMYIPVCVIAAGFVICFLSGLIAGNVSADENYAYISSSVSKE